MSAPDYELYRVITDYEALVDGFWDRIEDLETTLALPSFADGVVQKLLTKNPGGSVQQPRNHRSAKLKRTFGWESLPKMLKDTGLALVLVVDDKRFAAVKDQLVKRKRPRKPAIAGIVESPWLFRKEKACEMGKRRFSLMTPAQRKRHQRKAAKARWAKQRKAKQMAQIAGDPAIDQAINTTMRASGGLNISQSSGIA
jgi:hypothetical protein